METTTQREQIVKAGWVFGNADGFVGERIYPSWQGALEGKRITLRDVRTLDGSFFIHNPWTNTVERSFESLAEVEGYILKHGKPVAEGANVWD